MWTVNPGNFRVRGGNDSKESGRPTTAEGGIITRDGRQKIITMTFSYVSAENSWDDIVSFYSVGIDITKEQKHQIFRMSIGQMTPGSAGFRQVFVCI